MREAYLTFVTPEPPAPPTIEEAQAAIEKERALQVEIKTLEDGLKILREPLYALWKKQANYPFGIMRTLGFEAGQVRRNVETGEEVVVVRMNDGIHTAAINGLTARRTVLHNDSRRIEPLTADKWENTGRTVKPSWQGFYYGQSVPKAAEPKPYQAGETLIQLPH